MEKNNELKLIIAEMIAVNYDKFSSFSQKDQDFFTTYMTGWLFLKRKKQVTNETIQEEIPQRTTVTINLLYYFKNGNFSTPALQDMREIILRSNSVTIVKGIINQILVQIKKEGYKFSLELEVQIQTLLRQALQTSVFILPEMQIAIRSEEIAITVLAKYPVGRFSLIETLVALIEKILNSNMTFGKAGKKILEALKMVLMRP